MAQLQDAPCLPLDAFAGGVGGFATSTQGRARVLLQAEVDVLLQDALPPGVTFLEHEVTAAAPELLLEMDGKRCACGRCGRDRAPADGGQRLEDAAWAVEARLLAKNSACYRAELRVRFAVGPWFGDGRTWPVAQFLDDVVHLGFEQDGSVQGGVCQLVYDQISAERGSIGLPCSLRASLVALLELLQDKPPVSVYGDAGNPDLHRSWAAYAGGNKRKLDVIERYVGRALHKELFVSSYSTDLDWAAVLDPALRDVLAARDGPGGPAGVRALLREEIPNVWSFPFFTGEFCAKLVAEVEHYEASGLPILRPNSMNNYGIILNMIGLEGFVHCLQREVIRPIASQMLPEEGEWLDGQHSFTVRYAANEDLGLDMHTDDSDVTCNICLGKTFEGAGLSFCGVIGAADHRQFKHQYQVLC